MQCCGLNSLFCVFVSISSSLCPNWSEIFAKSAVEQSPFVCWIWIFRKTEQRSRSVVHASMLVHRICRRHGQHIGRTIGHVNALQQTELIGMNEIISFIAQRFPIPQWMKTFVRSLFSLMCLWLPLVFVLGERFIVFDKRRLLALLRFKSFRLNFLRGSRPEWSRKKGAVLCG